MTIFIMQSLRDTKSYINAMLSRLPGIISTVAVLLSHASLPHRQCHSGSTWVRICDLGPCPLVIFSFDTPELVGRRPCCRSGISIILRRFWHQGAWAVLSLYVITNFRDILRMLPLLILLQLANWAVFLALWIAIAVDISGDSSHCSVVSGEHSSDTPCQTMYAAFAFTIAGWVLFSHALTESVHEWFQTREQIMASKWHEPRDSV